MSESVEIKSKKQCFLGTLNISLKPTSALRIITMGSSMFQTSKTLFSDND